ncbi:MAG: transporter permease [Fluviicola sp.]|jgi:phospholipid/cholesterol/gamma-HCH transport system permease protein|uniref:MlaE family ABC transporter permease n=1 Tax=Fluviicola sp. TaxID=1917219 RepID=UPI00261C3B25|nr:ABC transporter permease [Fluviicola sp.]MDF3026575.1 transporter permease [Fluviicola sp.]
MSQNLKGIVTEIGDITRFTLRFFGVSFRKGYEFKEMLRQCFFLGYKSLGLVIITGFIIGLVITIQSRPTLVKFGAEAWLPGMISVSLVREIVPVITALICAGKIGSGIGAELGSMKVTEQIDAMEVSGTNPFKYLVATRVTAVTLMVPLLVVFADAISLYGGYLGVNLRGSISWNLYWAQVLDSLSFGDIIPSIVKTFFFGFAIGIIGCYKGYTTQRGTEGVGWSANAAVVISSLLVFILDLVAVQITDLLQLV